MRKILPHLLLVALCFPFSLDAEQEIAPTDLPDLLFVSESALGGFGMLSYSAGENQYRLVDGTIFSYVHESGSIRLMRDDERSGTMANPKSLVADGHALFGTNAYNRIYQYDPNTGALLKHFAYAEFSFNGGGTNTQLFAFNGTLLLLLWDRFITLTPSLDVVSNAERPEKSRGRFGSQRGGKLFNILVDNPNTYTDCFGPCNFPIVIRHTELDFSDPKNVITTSVEEELSEQFTIIESSLHEDMGWLLLVPHLDSRGSKLVFHPFTDLKHASARYPLAPGTRVLAMTDVAPSWMLLVSEASELALARVEVSGDQLSFRSFALPWEKRHISSAQLRIDESKQLLFVTADHRLAVYDISHTAPKLLLQQTFATASGAADFQLSSILVSPVKAVPSPPDRGKLEAIVRKDFWDTEDHRIISAEIAKLRSSDDWAIPLFVSVLQSKQKLFHGGMDYSLAALGRFGPRASAALTPLLENNLGSSYNPPQRALAFKLIKQIDPNGHKTIELIQANLEDAFKVRSTVELLEFIGSPATLELAAKTKSRWGL